MRITFIAQASVLIQTSDCTIWTDPWLIGKAFNESWALFPAPTWTEEMYNQVDYLWISHEHPDHFHMPSLKQMPQEFKERVTLLFQKNNSDKMPKAFQQLGFKNIQLLKHREIIQLTPKTKIQNTQVGQMDSALAVITEDCTLLNLNDCEANSLDCKTFVKDLGKINIVLNQFSMAGYNGYINYQDYLPKVAQQIWNNMLENHVDLGVDITIPFASNIYFCCEDNKHINNFANTPHDSYAFFQKQNKRMVLLYPGDSYDTFLNTDPSAKAIAKYQSLYQTRSQLVFDKTENISLETIKSAFLKRAEQLRTVFPAFLLKKMAWITVKIPDLNKQVRFSVYEQKFEELSSSSDFDLIIHSQPLYFAFDTPWGVQTLGVSARFLIKQNHGIWRWYRIITSLNNAELYLKPQYFFSRNNLNFIKSRLNGGLNQLLYQLRRMR